MDQGRCSGRAADARHRHLRLGRHLSALKDSRRGWDHHTLLMHQLRSLECPLAAFQLNSNGTPTHPLYLSYELKPRRWHNGTLHEELV
jgi:hypothetical protein